MKPITLFPCLIFLILISCGKEPCIIDGIIRLTSGHSLIGCKVNGSVIISGKNILVKDVEVDATDRLWGILIDTGSANIVIEGAEVYGAKRFGIGSYSWPEKSIRNVRVLNSSAHHNPGDPEFTENWSGSGIFLEGVIDSKIDNCEAFENGNLTNSATRNGPVGIWFHNSLRSKITNSRSHHNRTRKNHKDGGGFDLDGGCVECSIENCKSWDNAGAGFLVWQWTGAGEIRDLLFLNCTSINDQYGFHVGSGERQAIPGVVADGCTLVGKIAYRIRRDQVVIIKNSFLCGERIQERNGIAIEINNTICNGN